MIPTPLMLTMSVAIPLSTSIALKYFPSKQCWTYKQQIDLPLWIVNHVGSSTSKKGKIPGKTFDCDYKVIKYFWVEFTSWSNFSLEQLLIKGIMLPFQVLIQIFKCQSNSPVLLGITWSIVFPDFNFFASKPKNKTLSQLLLLLLCNNSRSMFMLWYLF